MKKNEIILTIVIVATFACSICLIYRRTMVNYDYVLISSDEVSETAE